jgi:hypothetical protein
LYWSSTMGTGDELRQGCKTGFTLTRPLWISMVTVRTDKHKQKML